MDRREFLKGCCATAAAGASGPTLFFSGPAKAAANSYDTFVLIFLRGGIDGLNLVVPISGDDRAHYEAARPDLSIKASGDFAARPLTLANGNASGFGLHPAATGLSEIWASGKLAIVHACGMPTVASRSHFDAQLYLDLGTPGQAGSGTGWLSRAWNTHPAYASEPDVPALAVNGRTPANLLGAPKALTMFQASSFALNTGAYAWQQYRDGMPPGTRGLNETLAHLWQGETGLERSGAAADASLRLIAQQSYSDPPSNWPQSTFASQLWTVAQSIRFNLGVRFATVDLGGWDTHEGQGTAGSGYHYYQSLIKTLSEGLTAFYTEMAAGGELSRVTLAVQSEFGRRVQQNASGGTDHGYGCPMLVLGGPVNGRRFYGKWPGLNPDTLATWFGDVPANTDFRRVFSELLIRRMGNNQISEVFPGYSGYQPIGLFQGNDSAPRETPASSPPAHEDPRAVSPPSRPTLPINRPVAAKPRPVTRPPPVAIHPIPAPSLTPYPWQFLLRLWWWITRKFPLLQP